ncbi:hypothetical protein LOM8899_04535 [Flavimaricola marinus]|uniref:Methyltransferase domain protein n=2 Tax=Flavimaricola marinus TaxID=1819565 RepID=A0A238LNJ8_9RHOB|nr:hypothetical protein LOM8899_04535 [Flavimaricola marinus]
MVTAADIDSIRRIVSDHGSDSVTVELGPWLGAISTAIADITNLHVVDNFKWTKHHAKKVPKKIEPGESFRPYYETIIAGFGQSVTIHSCDFETFTWESGAIDVVVIDAPKSAKMLKLCLQSVLPYLNDDGEILLKHGLSPLYTDMANYVALLASEGVLSIPEQTVEASLTVLRLSKGPRSSRFEEIDSEAPLPMSGNPIEKAVHLHADHGFRFYAAVDAARRNAWTLAINELSKMKPNTKLLRVWDKIEPVLHKLTNDDDGLTNFSEIVEVHHSQAPKAKLPVAFHKSAALAQRGYWLNNAANAWRSASYRPDIIERAYDYGYLNWPSKVREIVAGKDVLDVGCGPGLHGIGYLVAGAKSYLGLDPIVKPDVDRVKNLTARTKDPFGWTPNQISALIEPWHVSPQAVGDTDKVRRFDMATLHNVTEHLHQLDEIFADIAIRLRKGGKILYNHHNFYCWNGHHLPPKKVGKIDTSDPKQRDMIDWGHVEYDPAPEHYIARGLNRIRLDEIIAITEKYFEIEVSEEIPSRPDTGVNRLTDEIRRRYPYLTDRDFLTQNLFCLARLRD